MLSLVGLGVCGDITEKGLDEIKHADVVYYEPYTLIYPKEIRKKIINRFKPEVISRSDVESNFLINKSKNMNIVLLVGGNPLIATTHISLILDCINKNIPYKVIHNSSIFTSAIGVSGLQTYKFGKTATLVNPRENYKPTSSLKLIRENLKNGMHTIVLLDTEPKPMEADTALNMLTEFKKVIVLSRVGCEDENVSVGNPNELLKKLELLGKSPFTIIVPTKLHFLEEEFLDKFLV